MRPLAADTIPKDRPARRGPHLILLTVLALLVPTVASCGDDERAILDLAVSASLCIDEGGCEDFRVRGAEVTATLGAEKRVKTTDDAGRVRFSFASPGTVTVTISPTSWKVAPVEQKIDLSIGGYSAAIRVARFTGAVTTP